MPSPIASSNKVSRPHMQLDNIHVDERERLILDRSYAAAVAASKQSPNARRRSINNNTPCYQKQTILDSHAQVNSKSVITAPSSPSRKYVDFLNCSTFYFYFCFISDFGHYNVFR